MSTEALPILLVTTTKSAAALTTPSTTRVMTTTEELTSLNCFEVKQLPCSSVYRVNPASEVWAVEVPFGDLVGSDVYEFHCVLFLISIHTKLCKKTLDK